MKRSRMDELIFQEFKGTGNMKWCSIRRLAINAFIRRSIFSFPEPAVKNCFATVELEKINLIRRGLAGHNQAKRLSSVNVREKNPD